MSELLHDRENNEDTQRHLDENRDKFEGDGEYLHRLMKLGRRLSSQDAHDLKIDSRRLRELHSAGKCEKVWKLNDAGKRMYVEYFCKMPESPTKAKAIKWATELLEKMKNEGTQLNLL